MLKIAKRIKNNYFRTTNKYQSLSSAFTHPGTASSIQILTWAKRIQNRIAVNMGQPDLIIKYREIEKSISEIEKHIFSIRNISDMELVSNVLINKIIDTIPEDDIAMQFSHVLFFDIADQLYFENFKVKGSPEFKNKTSFFKALLMNKSNEAFTFKDYFITRILKLNENDSNREILENVYFEISNTISVRCFNISYKIDLQNKTLIFQDVNEVFGEDNKEKLSDLGILNV